MKKYSITLINGFILGISTMLFIGAKSQPKSLGDIVVNSISVIDENDKLKAIIDTDDDDNGVLKMFNKIGSTVISGASIRTSNSAGKEMLFIGSEYAGYGGSVAIKNSKGNDIAYIGINTQFDNGMIATRNSEGTMETYIGSSAAYNGGVIQTLNSKGREVVHIGSDKPTEDGKVILFDENGGSGWTLKGRRWFYTITHPKKFNEN